MCLEICDLGFGKRSRGVGGIFFFFSQSRGIFSERERQGGGLKKIGRPFFFSERERERKRER